MRKIILARLKKEYKLSKRMIILIVFMIGTLTMFACSIDNEMEKLPLTNIEPDNKLPRQKVIKERFDYKGKDDEVNINYEMQLVDYGDYNGFKTIRYGKDNFEWIILDEIDDKLLLLSKDVMNLWVNYQFYKYDTFPNEYNLLNEMIDSVPEFFALNLGNEYISKVKFDKDNIIFDVEDGVQFFNLSEKELKKYFGDVNTDGINKYYTASCNDKNYNLYHCFGNGWYKDNVPYYLRDDTNSGKFKKWVGTYGRIYNDDKNSNNYDRIGIRPAMYVNKSEALKYLSEYYQNDEKMTNTVVHILGENYGTDINGKICRDSICVSDNADFYLTDEYGRIMFTETKDIIEKSFGNDIKGQLFLYDQGKVSGLLVDTLIMNCDMDSSGGIYDKYTSMVLPYMNGFFIHVWKNAFYKVGKKIDNPYHIKKDDNVYRIEDCGYLTNEDGEILTINIATPGYISFKINDIYSNNTVEKKRYYLNKEKFYCGTIKNIDGIDRYFDENGFLITNDVYKLHQNISLNKYRFIDESGIAATCSETKMVNSRIFDIQDGGLVYHDQFKNIGDKYYYYNNDGVRAINEKIADKWVADKNGVVAGINYDNYRSCNEYIKYYNIMYPGDKEKAFNMRSKLLDILKQTNIYKKTKTQSIIYDLENKNANKKPTIISNYDIEVESTDKNFYKNIWKINGEIIKNSVIYASNNIYGTDANGRILKNGLCIGKDGLTYVTDEDGKIILNKSYGCVRNDDKYYFENKGNIFTEDELILEKFGKKILFNKNHTIKEIVNIYEIENDEKNSKRHIKGFDGKKDFVVADWYKGYQVDNEGHIVEKDDTGYYEFGNEKRFYRKTDKGGYYCVNSEYGSNVVFDENGFLLRNGLYQYGDFLYLTDESGKKVSADENDLAMLVDGHKSFGRRIDLEKGTVYVGSNGIINSKFIFIKSDNTYDIYYANDDGYIVKNCWLTDRLHFDFDGKLETENVTEYNAKVYENWIKFYEIMNY